jgi:hypothetical protein
MAQYIVKLVNRADLSDEQKHSVQNAVQKKFDEAFEGTSDGVNVSWGDGSVNDNYVVHFVPDVDNSYLRKKWPRADIDPEAGGHTHSHGPLSGTEVYRRRNGRQFHASEYALTVVHESMHNLYPRQTKDFVHEMDGGGEAAGLAAAHYSLKSKFTDHNKQVIQKGFSVKNPQYL